MESVFPNGEVLWAIVGSLNWNADVEKVSRARDARSIRGLAKTDVRNMQGLWIEKQKYDHHFQEKFMKKIYKKVVDAYCVQNNLDILKSLTCKIGLVI